MLYKKLMKFIKRCYSLFRKAVILFYFIVVRPGKQGVTIFLYHDIGNTPSEFDAQYGLNVTDQTFRKQIQWIRSNFNIIHPADLVNGKVLPQNPAIISFDDGFLGAFENGISYLVQQKIPSIMFLNMDCILSGKPILSAIACYMAIYSREFREFADKIGLEAPYHLTLNPYHYGLYRKEAGEIDYEKVIAYQGKIANISIIAAYNDKDTIVYGNHLFDHWNSEALTDEEFENAYLDNARILSTFENAINMFAFPNGQPGTCFSKRHINALSRLGADKIFYSSGGSNLDNHSFLLNRVALVENDKGLKLWLKISQSRALAKNKG